MTTNLQYFDVKCMQSLDREHESQLELLKNNQIEKIQKELTKSTFKN